MAALGIPFEQAQWRSVRTLSGGEQKRLVLEALLRGTDEGLLLDEPDNYLDVPTKRWLETQLAASAKTVLFVSHDRELLSRTATQVASLEPTAAGSTLWVHGAGFATFAQARADRRSRLEELTRRWEEEQAKLRELVNTLKTKAAFNDGLASRYQAAQTRLRKFEQAGPPQVMARDQDVRVRLTGGRTAKRAVVADRLELTGLMRPFDLEVWFGERVAVLGSNGSGKSHFLRLLAAGGTDPDREHAPVDESPEHAARMHAATVAHTGRVTLGSRVRPGWFAQNDIHPELADRTLLEILHRGEGSRDGMGREPASKALDRYADGPAAYTREALAAPTARAVIDRLLLGAADACSGAAVRRTGALADLNKHQGFVRRAHDQVNLAAAAPRRPIIGLDPSQARLGQPGHRRRFGRVTPGLGGNLLRRRHSTACRVLGGQLIRLFSGKPH